MPVITPAREDVFDALLAQLETAGTTFKTYTRRWKSAWDDPAQMVPLLPMLVQSDNREVQTWTNRGIGSPNIWTISLQLYAKIPVQSLPGAPGVPDKTTPGSKVLNPLLDAVFTALAPIGPDGLQTLGDLVLDCRIEGTITKVLGDEDPSGLCGALVPVNILVL